MDLEKNNKRRIHFIRRILFILFCAAPVLHLFAQQAPVIPAAGLPAGVYKYKASFKMGEIPMDLNMAISVRETGAEWTVTEITIAELTGEISDAGVYEKKSLMLTTRAFKQGQAMIDLAFKEDRVKGKMVISGQEKLFDVETGGPLFGDGPGFIFAIGALPLAKGYAASFRSFDIETQKLTQTQLKVAGMEQITVPAGSFESYRVEISSEGSGSGDYTVWIAKSSRKPVKVITALPEIGGAKLTAELQ
jgi:hypothetical protein